MKGKNGNSGYEHEKNTWSQKYYSIFNSLILNFRVPPKIRGLFFVGAASYRERCDFWHADRGKMPLPHESRKLS